MEKKKGNRVLMLRIMLGVCVAVFLASGYMLIRDYIETSRQQETFDQLNSRFAMEAQQAVMQQEPGVEPGEGEAAKKQRVSPQEWREQWERLAQERFQVYQSMKAENSDMIGWIQIGRAHV